MIKNNSIRKRVWITSIVKKMVSCNSLVDIEFFLFPVCNYVNTKLLTLYNLKFIKAWITQVMNLGCITKGRQEIEFVTFNLLFSS